MAGASERAGAAPRVNDRQAGQRYAPIAAVIVLVLVLSTIHLLPQLRDPFAETTTDRSQPVLLKSITQQASDDPDAQEVALEAAHVVLGSELLPGSVEDALLLVVGAGSLLPLCGSTAGVTPCEDGDDGGQRQQAGGPGQYPGGGLQKQR